MKLLYLISCGMDHPDDITVRALKTIARCDIIMGARRLINIHAGGEEWEQRRVVLPAKAIDAANIINKSDSNTIGVLLSGDAGFYSQAVGLRRYVKGRKIVTIPGVSVVQAISARLNIPWQDLEMISLHNISLSNDSAVKLDITKNSLILLRKGVELQDIFLDSSKTLESFSVYVAVKLGSSDEKLFEWRGECYKCEALSTLLIIKRGDR